MVSNMESTNSEVVRMEVKEFLATVESWRLTVNRAIDNPTIANFILEFLLSETADFIDAVNEKIAAGPQTQREDLQEMCGDWIRDNFDEALKYYRDGVSDAEDDLAEGNPDCRANAPKEGGVFGNDQLHVDAYDRGYEWGLRHAVQRTPAVIPHRSTELNSKEPKIQAETKDASEPKDQGIGDQPLVSVRTDAKELGESIAHFLHWSGWLDCKGSQNLAATFTDADGQQTHMGTKTFERLESSLDDVFPGWRNWRTIYGGDSSH